MMMVQDSEMIKNSEMIQDSEMMQKSPKVFSQNTFRLDPSQLMSPVDLFGYADSLPDRQNCTVVARDQTLPPAQNIREDVPAKAQREASVAPQPPKHRSRLPIAPPGTHELPPPSAQSLNGSGEVDRWMTSASCTPADVPVEAQREPPVAPQQPKQQSRFPTAPPGSRQLPPPPAQSFNGSDEDDQWMNIESCTPTVMEVDDDEESPIIETCTPTMPSPDQTSLQPMSQPSSEYYSQSDSQPPPLPPKDFMSEADPQHSAPAVRQHLAPAVLQPSAPAVRQHSTPAAPQHTAPAVPQYSFPAFPQHSKPQFDLTQLLMTQLRSMESAMGLDPLPQYSKTRANALKSNENFQAHIVSSVSAAIHSQIRPPLMTRFGY